MTKVLNSFGWLSLKRQSSTSAEGAQDAEILGIGQSQTDVKTVREWRQIS
jgi:hypothetical protein